MELAGPNAPVSSNCGSFDWGLSFFYGRKVFTGIEQQPVTGTSYVGVGVLDAQSRSPRRSSDAAGHGIFARRSTERPTSMPI